MKKISEVFDFSFLLDFLYKFASF